jgi:hypothetical protein
MAEADTLVLTDSALLNLPHNEAVQKALPHLKRALDSTGFKPSGGCRPCQNSARRKTAAVRAVKNALGALTDQGKAALKGALKATRVRYHQVDGTGRTMAVEF